MRVPMRVPRRVPMRVPRRVPRRVLGRVSWAKQIFAMVYRVVPATAPCGGNPVRVAEWQTR